MGTTNSQRNYQDQIDAWLKEKALKMITDNLNISCQEVTYKLSLPKSCQFFSNVWFLDLKLTNNEAVSVDQSDKKDTIHLVIKKPIPLQFVDGSVQQDRLFHDEILFFERVVGEKDEFPRCLLAIEDKKNFYNSVIVTENIEYLGYQMCPESYDIPFEYTISAVQAIGRFHGMGYAMKTRHPKKFYKIVDDIQENRFFPGDRFSKFVNLCSIRPVKWLRKQNYDSNFVDLMEKHLSDAYTNVMIDAITPVEPLAVLCHGDFTRNNIFFRKTECGLDSMLIDFALLRYSQPAIDLSTFMYLNASRECRNERFDKIFTAYHDALINYLQEKGIIDLDKYSYAKLLDDYKRRAMFGYIIAVFFLPTTRYGVYNSESLVDFNVEKLAHDTNEYGGDIMSQDLADTLFELRDNGYLDHILNCES